LQEISKIEESLGTILQYHQTILFLQEQLEDSAKSLKDLAKEYQKEYRSKNNEQECLREIEAALLVSTAVKQIMLFHDKQLIMQFDNGVI
jgi:ATP-dependent protease HslVU (ClpYQ) peptidase subunit